MSQHRPHQIHDHHVASLAVVYRQEAPPQEVAEQPGSPAGPPHERELAIRWGWPKEAVLVIEEDRGASGSGTGRDGFKRVRKLVAQEQVGIIMVSTTSRPPRFGSDLLSLCGLCQDTDTLIALNGAIADLNKQTDYRLANVRLIVVEEENQQRAERLMLAKRHYALRGRAVSRPPTGYVKTAKGQWEKDVPAVQERIADVFRFYDSLGSVGKVVQFLVVKGLKMPLRTPAGQLRWVRPTHSRIYGILTNPAFTGHYIYGRHASVQGTLCRKHRKTTSEEQIVIPDHHEPYITIEEWHRINGRLKSHATRVRQQAGNDAAA